MDLRREEDFLFGIVGFVIKVGRGGVKGVFVEKSCKSVSNRTIAF